MGENGGTMNASEVLVTADPVPAARAALARLAVFAVTGVGLAALAATTGFGIPCPFRLATGVRCPLCGATTMGVALLRGDLAGAWRANGFVLVVLVQLLVAGLVWAAEALSRRCHWPAGWPGSLDRWLLLWGAAGVLFDLVRVVG